MKIIDHEIKRYVLRVRAFKKDQDTLEQMQMTHNPEIENHIKHMRKEEAKLGVMVKKQEKVLFVAFHLLLNLAEDLQIERKMKNRRIIS